MNLIFEFIRYQWLAKNRHGIHSPFVYDLSDKCFKIKREKADEILLQEYESKLKSNNSKIHIQDFGAGSRKMGTERLINKIYKTSSSKGKFGKLLYQLNRHFEFNNVLEFGTSLGIGTLNLHLGNPSSKITSLEACPETHHFTSSQLLNQFSNIKLINQTFDKFLNASQNQKFDFIFIDGHHDGNALLNYLEKLKPIAHSESIFLLDDIRWSQSMCDAWNNIKEDKSYNLTIDLFRMGLISPRPQQQKEHFVVKY
ncbi:MAG: class I SAM-dependent methyltransferase [Bacteroidetes bacterium]|nr:class I SAM-dependent methyltransferase [Bacteroidota bacterium]